VDIRNLTPSAQKRRDFSRWLALACCLSLPASPFLAQGQSQLQPPRHRSAEGESKDKRVEEIILDRLLAQIAVSARVLQLAETSSERISKLPAIAPGAPPLLSFRYFEGKQRHRFGNLDLVMDDAGH